MDLSQEKTEQATPRRREKAREEGQVAKSKDLTDAITLFASMLLLQFFMGTTFGKLKQLMRGALTFDYLSRINRESIVSLFSFYLFENFKLIIPYLIFTAILGAAINFLQIGPMLNVKGLMPKFDKINPIKGVKNLFSLRSFVELIKSIFKILVVATTAYLVLKNEWQILWDIPFMSLNEGVIVIGKIILKLGMVVSIILIALGIGDFVYQKYEFEKNIRMSKQEVKQEHKESEGDPMLQSKRKEKMREMSMNRMIQEVPDADVVITNPTHISVAIKYDIDNMEAPIVLAMGEDKVAKRIREIAKEEEIELVENKPLARALYKTAEVGEEIPVDLYQAVAEVLAFVYRLQNRKF